MATEVSPFRVPPGWNMRIPGWLLLLCICGVVYGSLIPFELRPHTLPDAWNVFLHIRYLNLDVVSRADWIANIVLYIPLGFLAVGWLHSFSRRHRFTWGIAVFAFVACSLVASVIEFIQIFFAPRTVSINDLIAEYLGSLLGIVLWATTRQQLGSSLHQLIHGGRRAIQVLLMLYAVAYVALSLFPYDFLFSLQELKWKLATDQYGWFVAGGACQGLLRCLLKFTSEVMAAVPLGILLAMHKPKASGSPILMAFTGGVLLGILLEAGQFFTASGIAQGVSIVNRGIGFAAGAWLMAHSPRVRFAIMPAFAMKLLTFSIVPYLVAVLAANGWFTEPWITLDEGLQSLHAEMFLPFYFHYFSTEVNAVQSLLANAGLYFPIGLAYWLKCYLERSARGRGWVPVVVAGCLAFVVEAGKLFLAARHPDPTNVLIAAVASWLAWRLAMWVEMQASVSHATEIVTAKPKPVLLAPVHGHLLHRLLAVMLLGIVVMAVANYPLHATVLGLGLAAYTVLLWRRPALWLFCVPALLPLMNFSPWTGWLFVDELDLVVLTSVAMNLWTWSPMKNPVTIPTSIKLLIIFLMTGYLVSMAIGLFPLQAIDANVFADYYSSYNALRVGKGMLWAVLLLPLMMKTMEDPSRAERYFTLGMLAGLVGVIVVTLWERWTFPGLLNFYSEFRTAAMFYEMHTGGASIDAYLAATLPFIAACFLIWRNFTGYICGITLFGLGLYAFFVTFSRIDFVAFALSALILFAGFMRSGWSERRFYTVTITLAVVMALVLIPVLRGPYIQSRFATVSEDLDARLDHWKEALDIKSDDILTSVFGMGLGSYPRATYLYHLGKGMPQTFRYVHDRGNTFLHLGTGDSNLYILQNVALTQPGKYLIEASIRTENTTGTLVALLCEKTLLYSLKCESATLRSVSKERRWTDVQASIDVGEIGQVGHRARPVTFSIYNFNDKHNPEKNSSVDIDNIRLIDQAGVDIMANGDFSQGQARWFFTVDDHMSWHIKNMWINILFEQGWCGLALMTILIIYTLKKLGKAAWSGSALPLIILSSLSGFLVVGLSDSLFDAPRLTLLFWMLVFFSLGYTFSVSESADRKQV